MLGDRESGHLDHTDALARPGLDPWLARRIARAGRSARVGEQFAWLHPTLVGRSRAGAVAPVSRYGVAYSGEHGRAGNSCCVPWGKQHRLARAAALLAWGGGASRARAEPGRAHRRTCGRVAASWIGRYWTADRWQLQLDQRTRPLRWWWSFLRERSQDSQGYLPLSLMASGVAVILGGIWGAVPTPFAASLGATHTLDKLAWLLGGQLVILVLAMGLLCAARDVIGFPGRLVPVSVRSRVRTLALFMPLAMAGGLVATVEGVLMALFTPLLGWLIDESRSVDTVLVMVGLVFALALACSLLALGASFRRPVRMQRTTTRLAVALEA